MNKYLKNINELTRQNGEVYYKSNLVSSLKWDLSGDIHKVTAICNNFFCSVELTKEAVFNSNCQCIIGKNGVTCKHIVALIYAYIEQAKLMLEEKSDFLKNYTTNNDVLNVITALPKAIEEKLFRLKISNLFFDIEVIDQVKVNEILKDYDEVIKVLDTLEGDIYLKEEQQIEFSHLKNLYNWIYTFNNINQMKLESNVHSIFHINDILENHNNLIKFQINNVDYNLEIIHNVNRIVDVYATKTSLGYIVSSNIQDGIYFSLSDDIYYFLIFKDKIEWFKTNWNNVDNPNQIFRINLKTKSEQTFNQKLSEIRENGLFESNIIGQGIRAQAKSKLFFGYDFSHQKCYLKFQSENDKDILKKYFSKFSELFDETNRQILVDKHIDIATILQKLETIKKEGTIEVFIAAAFKTKKRTKLSFHFERANNWLNLTASGEFDPNTLEQIFSAYNAGKKYYSVNEQLYDLEESGLDEIKKILNNLSLHDTELSVNMQLENKDMFYLNNKFKSTELQNFISEFHENINKHKYIDENFIPGIKPFQVYGVNWLISILELSRGCILADEMGLGKTLQTIGLLKYQYQVQKLTKPSLVILPLSLVDNWVSEFKKFFPEQKVVKIGGKSDERKEIIGAIEENTIYITTYNLIKNDIDLIKDIDFLNVILDEGQYIKNFTSLWTKHIKAINSTNKLILSGTPVENNLLELWSIFDFILPGYLGDLKEFRNAYTGKNVEDNDLFELSLKVKPFILQRRKIDHLKLPNKNHTNILIEMTENERNIYNNLLLNVQEKLIISVDDKGEIVKNQIEILSLITKLRQFCCSPDLIGISNHDNTKANSLLQLIKSVLEKGDESKIVVFSNFASMLHIILDLLNQNGYEALIMTGENTSIQRTKIIDEFKTNPKAKILLLSLKSGGVGLNLTCANHVVHYNPWWNESAELQATDRLHRIGQENEVNVYRLLYNNSIESDIQNLKEMKTDIINKTINHSNYNELLKLLRDKKA
ncbi:MAG: SNF2-related protein [Mycoplasma sp.]